MGWEIIDEGNLLNAASLGSLIETTPAGTGCQLQLDLTASPAAWILNSVKTALTNAGVTGVNVTSSSPTMNIFWTKEGLNEEYDEGIAVAPLVIAAIIIAAIAVIAVVVIGWRFLNAVGPTFSKPLLIGLGIAAAALAGSIAYRNFRGR
jgi:hypothetical protein